MKSRVKSSFLNSISESVVVDVECEPNFILTLSVRGGVCEEQASNLRFFWDKKSLLCSSLSPEE